MRPRLAAGHIFLRCRTDSNSGEYLLASGHFCIIHPCQYQHLFSHTCSSIKKAKYRLACLALEEMFGRDNVDALFGGSGDDADDSDSASLREKVRPSCCLICASVFHC